MHLVACCHPPKTYTEAEAKALVAAALQRAFDVAAAFKHSAEARNWRDCMQQANRIGDAILALIDTAALEAVKAQARAEAVDIAKLERIANELSCIDAQCRAFADRIMSAIRAGEVQP